jgi:hypothetical protein
VEISHPRAGLQACFNAKMEKHARGVKRSTKGAVPLNDE